MKQQTFHLDGVTLELSALDSAKTEERQLSAAVCRKLGVSATCVQRLDLLKKSLDARDKGRLRFVYSLDVTVDLHLAKKPVKAAPAKKQAEFVIPTPAKKPALPPMVAGAGPAGLFAALVLAEAGLCPTVIEQGRPVEQREQDVDAFWQGGALDAASNIQFGEGGAGAFSDGKLTSRSKDPRGREVLRQLIAAGSDPAIAYWHKPHLGSDKLPGIIRNIRRRIEQLGGSFRYETTLLGVVREAGRLAGVTLRLPDGSTAAEDCRQLILAPGNAARDLWRQLLADGMLLEAKPFAVGFRIRQAQSLIDRAQYGKFAGHPLLGAADYALTYQEKNQERGCYTFCNCPGGYIVNASSVPNQLVVNGVSLSARDSGWANAAVVAQVFPGRDFGCDPLDGVLFQEKLEGEAFCLGGGNHFLPVMSTDAFFGGAETLGADSRGIKAPGVHTADLRHILPSDLTEAIGHALRHWDGQIPGFAREALLAAVESRTSAPLRIVRGADRMAEDFPGVYPAGEGAGYAGGIVSSALDGMNAALAAVEHLSATI